MGNHNAIPNGAGSSKARLNLKTKSWSAVIVVLFASICACSYNIYEAAHWGNTEKVIAYLDGGVDVNMPNRWGRTPLAIALFRKHYNTARLLVEKGAQINVIDPLRHVPIIIYPVIDGNLEMIRFLTDHGADVNLANREGFTALIEAAYYGHTEIGRLLIEHGADINATTVGNVTALSNARGRKNKAFEKMLVNIIEQREREELLYRRAKRDRTIPAFENYLNNFPEGKYIKEAQEAFEALYYREATGSHKLEANQGYLERFPNGKHSEEVRHRLAYLPLMNACLNLEYEKIDHLLSAGKSLKGQKEPAIVLMRLLQKQTQQTLRLSEFHVREVRGLSKEEKLRDLEIFKKLLDAGADPCLMRIKGFQRAGRESLDGVADLYSTGSAGRIVPADEGGMSALDFAEANHLANYKAYLLSKGVKPLSAPAKSDEHAKNIVRTPQKTSSNLARNASGRRTKAGSKTASTIVTLNTVHMKTLKNEKCANHTPDYAKYHTIVHLLANRPIGTVEKGGKNMNAYIVTAEGRDPVTGRERCIGLSVDFNSLFSGAGTKDNPAKMHMRAGEPGTRITFDGDEKDPFEPVPGLRIWQGAIDIDPDCGLVIHAEKAK